MQGVKGAINMASCPPSRRRQKITGLLGYNKILLVARDEEKLVTRHRFAVWKGALDGFPVTGLAMISDDRLRPRALMRRAVAASRQGSAKV